MANRMNEIQDAIAALAQQMQAVTQALATTQQQIQQLAANAAAASGAPLPPTSVTFAETPAKADPTAILDYTSKYGLAIYEYGKSSLYDEGTPKFDLEREGASRFEKDVQARVKRMGWDDVNQGITTYTVDGQSIDIITDYGRITKEDIKTQSEPLFLSGGARSTTRAAQNNAMMGTMLLDSLTKEAKTQVEVFANEYEFSDGGTSNKKIIVAAALYKVIMKLTTMDDKSTNQSLRDAIRNLPQYAISVNGDVPKINTYFDVNYAQLKARGEEFHDKENPLRHLRQCSR